MKVQSTLLRLALALSCSGAGCSHGAPAPRSSAAPEPPAAPSAPSVARQPAPASGPARDVAFPPIHHEALANGLSLDVVTHKQLPVVSIELVIQSGRTSDPADLPGVASAVADMLREGTLKKPGARFTEAVEYLGADFHTSAGLETVRIRVSALSEHFDAALALLAEATLTPAFDATELAKLKKRTLDELRLKKEQPAWLARRELAKALYGEHPYARTDTTEEATKKLAKANLTAFHQRHFAPNNAFLVVVGDVETAAVQQAAQKLFGGWKKRDVAKPAYPAPVARQTREIIVIDRPASVQSLFAIGNLALKRSDPGFLPLAVANHILGGSAASRLFLDLREKRSLTYGVYSRLDETVDVGAFRAGGSVRNEVTEAAAGAFFEHFERIVTSAPPQDELESARNYLADSFPLDIETAGRIANMISDLRVFGLPDDYWDTYRSNIRKVDSAEALAAAKRSIRPDQAVVVVVGRAADIAEGLKRLGPVRIVDVDGKPLTEQTAPVSTIPSPAQQTGAAGASPHP